MNIIITGSTGMVGKAVLLEAIDDNRIEKILVINRTSLASEYPKLKEILIQDFTQIGTQKEYLKGYDACFHCMGVSSFGMSESQYTYLTYDITKAFVDTLYEINPSMVFNYVTGEGTDNSEKGRIMWARVKGKTENYILNKGFKGAYMIRLGALLPEKGIQSKTKLYNTLYIFLRPLFPLLKKSKNIITTTNFGKAMLNTLFYPQDDIFLTNTMLNKISQLK